MDETILHPAPLSDSSDALRALAEPTRQRILQVLTHEELNVSELVEILGLPQSTISRHLRVLREAELIRDRRHGTSTLYSAMTPPDDTDIADDDVRGFMVRWLGAQPLADGLDERLRRVLATRGGNATGFFNRLGKRWDDLRNEAFGEQFALEAFLPLLPHDWTVADIGSGTGYLLPILAAHFAKVIAVDPAESMLECGRQRVADCNATNVDFHRGELGKLPIPTGSIDLAVALLVLHHVKEPQPALAEMRRALRRGGRVLIVEQEAHEDQGFYERMKDLWWGFSPEEFCKLLTKTGFRDVQSRRLHTAGATSGRVEAPPLFVVTARK